MRRVRFRDLPISRKLLLIYGSILLVSLVGSGALIYGFVKKAVEENVERELTNSTGMILNMVRTAANVSIRNHLRGIAEKNREILEDLRNRAGEAGEATAREEAARILLSQRIGTTGYIYCLNSRGIIVVHPKPTLVGANLSRFGFIQEQLRRHEGYIEYDWANPGEPQPRPKALYMTYFAPWDWIVSVSSYREEFDEMVKVADFRSRILSVTFGKTGYPFVVGPGGRIIIHPTMEGANLNTFQDDRGWMFGRDILKRKNGRIVYLWRNPGEPQAREKVVIFSHISELDWIVASSYYVDEIYQPLRTVGTVIGLTVLFSLLTAVTLTFWVSALITRPITSLMKKFAAGAEGDFSVRMEQISGDEIGRLGSFFNSFMDRFTQHRRELERSEARFRDIFDGAVEGVFRTSLDGRFLAANPSMARIFGFSNVGELIEHFKDIGRELYRDPEVRRMVLHELQTKGVVTGLEAEFVRRDGSPVWAAINCRVIRNANGEIEGIEGFASDITRRKLAEQEKSLLEEQLLLSQKMESLGRLAGGVAHDFNNLLTAIMGNVDLAMTELRTADPLYPRLAEVAKAADSAAGLTRQLLAFSRKQVIEPSILDLNRLIQNMQGMLRRLIGEDVEMSSILEPDLGRIQADVGQLESIIVNLVVNARDAMPQGGRLILGTANVVLDEGYCASHLEATPGSYVQLSVRDTGTGLSEEAKAHLFEPFFTTKPLGKGTGLGLASVYGAVKQNGGSIEFSSEIGRGTEFRVYFPMVMGAETEFTSPIEVDHLEGTETILLVEDEPAVLELATEVLTRQGYQVLACDRPSEAIQAAARNPGMIHLMITDVVMPEMNGRSLAKKISVILPGIRVLYTSGYTGDILGMHGVLEGGVHFIGKPYTPWSLVRKVRQILDEALVR